jgi:hypothetical protein
MAMSITELERSLRSLRLSGMSATLQARALQVASHDMDFIEAFGWLVQDELDRRRSRLLDRRYTLSGLAERKDLASFDWTYNPRLDGVKQHGRLNDNHLCRLDGDDCRRLRVHGVAPLIDCR